MKIRVVKPGLNAFLLVYTLVLIGFYELYPKPLFDTSYSFVLNDRENKFLGARVADDGQWRFPLIDSVPSKFENCILLFEDKRFYFHPGVDAAAVMRALYQNFDRGEIVSGASTITMQTVRLSYGNKARTIKQKIIEVLVSISVELHLSKSEILRLYSSHAPFGGNVVGLEAASWRYFSKPSYKLSWAESATLAVLPNNPSVILPGRNELILRKKRDRLLKSLLEKNRIDSTTYELALLEEIPQKPKALVDIAPHFLEWRKSLSDKSPYYSSLSSTLQGKVQYALNDHVLNLKENGIHHAAAIVINVKSGQLEAYCGNNTNAKSDHPGNDVDIIQAPRSPGSALKPLLYSLAMSDGILYPTTLLPDVPTYIHDFAPKKL